MTNEVKRAIHAFNERLRYARNKYGADSSIVDAMITEAKQVVNLTWTKDNKGISLGKANENALQLPFEREEFSKFVMNNSARNLLDKTLYTSERFKERFKEDLSNAQTLKGGERAAEEERLFAEMTHITKMYNEIFEKIASDSSYDVAKECYEKFKGGAYDEIIELYLDEKLTISDLIKIIYDDVPLSEVLGKKKGKRGRKGKKSKNDSYIKKDKEEKNSKGSFYDFTKNRGNKK